MSYPYTYPRREDMGTKGTPTLGVLPFLLPIPVGTLSTTSQHEARNAA